MRTLLHIGEVAQLLGVTTKTIRHYQKIGLLQEPERTASGYRLFSAHDLLRVQRIRRLQALGLSLKRIKTILFQYPQNGSKQPDEPTQERSLREVLQTLDEELHMEIEQLQARHERIQALLNETNFTSVEQLPIESPGFALAQELLGERLTSISPEVMEQEKRIWALFDTFHWPAAYRSSIDQVIHHFVNQPELLSGLISFSEQLASLASLPEDAPEVAQLLEACLAHTELLELLRSINAYAKTVDPMTQPFGEIFGELVGEAFSPAQWRFFKDLSKYIVTPYTPHKENIKI